MQDFWHAVLVIFRVLCCEWIELVWDTARVAGPGAIVFYITALICTNFVILNLFLALLLKAFDVQKLMEAVAHNAAEAAAEETAKAHAGERDGGDGSGAAVDHDGRGGIGDGDSERRLVGAFNAGARDSGDDDGDGDGDGGLAPSRDRLLGKDDDHLAVLRPAFAANPRWSVDSDDWESTEGDRHSAAADGRRHHHHHHHHHHHNHHGDGNGGDRRAERIVTFEDEARSQQQRGVEQTEGKGTAPAAATTRFAGSAAKRGTVAAPSVPGELAVGASSPVGIGEALRGIDSEARGQGVQRSSSALPPQPTAASLTSSPRSRPTTTTTTTSNSSSSATATTTTTAAAVSGSLTCST